MSNKGDEMKDLKFRVWDGDNMLSLSEAIFSELVIIQHNRDDCFDISPDFDSIEIMQFTGLRDNNGVEIYESDIISDHVDIGVVKYSEKHAAFRVSYGNGTAKWFYDYNLKGEKESIEVIGNIYQNKELLK